MTIPSGPGPHSASGIAFTTAWLVTAAAANPLSFISRPVLVCVSPCDAQSQAALLLQAPNLHPQHALPLQLGFPVLHRRESVASVAPRFRKAGSSVSGRRTGVLRGLSD